MPAFDEYACLLSLISKMLEPGKSSSKLHDSKEMKELINRFPQFTPGDRLETPLVNV